MLALGRGLEDGRVRVQFPAGWLEFSSIRWHWLVGTPQQLDGRIGQPNADLIPATSLRLAEALPHDRPLAAFLECLRDPSSRSRVRPSPLCSMSSVLAATA